MAATSIYLFATEKHGIFTTSLSTQHLYSFKTQHQTTRPTFAVAHHQKTIQYDCNRCISALRKEFAMKFPNTKSSPSRHNLQCVTALVRNDSHFGIMQQKSMTAHLHQTDPPRYSYHHRLAGLWINSLYKLMPVVMYPPMTHQAVINLRYSFSHHSMTLMAIVRIFATFPPHRPTPLQHLHVPKCSVYTTHYNSME